MKHGGEYEGYIKDLVEDVADILGMSYDIHLVKDGRYGSPAWNGSWNGMVREVMDVVTVRL